jgi:tetratricopeptide (TPR) repeat protein
MSENGKPGSDNGEPAQLREAADWEKVLFAPERIEKWLQGEITLQQLNAIAGLEMLEVAVIGFSLYEQGCYDEAEFVFRGLCSLDPKEAYYETMLGAVYLAREELESAEACFSRALQLDDQEIAAYVNRGEVYLRQGRVIEAAHDFNKAADLDPQRKNPLSQRARLLAAAALETVERAKKLMGAAIGPDRSVLN